VHAERLDFFAVLAMTAAATFFIETISC